MKDMLIPISCDEFTNNVQIKFNNILDGFDSFQNFTLNGKLSNNSENNIIDFIYNIFEKNDNECYIDFYINRLNTEDKQKLMNIVDDEHKDLLQNIIDMKHDGIYYKVLSENILPFFIKLNTRELFFVTFYFTKKPVTIWGNYELKFPCFFNDSATLDYYYAIAKNLNIIE